MHHTKQTKIHLSAFLAFFSLFCIALMNRCTEPYMPQFKEYEDVLVVYGEISNEPGPYTVILMKTSDLNSDVDEFLSGASVTIYDTKGNSIPFFEKSGGIYKTQDSGFRGEVGEAYYIKVEIPEGEVFQSTPEIIQPPQEMDSIFYDLILNEKVNDDSDYSINIKVNSSFYSDNNLYCKYSYEETWKIFSIYRYKYAPEGVNTDVCWKFDNEDKIVIKSTEGYNENVLSEVLVTSIPETSSKLYSTYSILVKQHVISRQQYYFLKSLREASFDIESLFGTIPFSVKGNVYNIYDDNDPVLGFFGASSITSKRLFIDESALPAFFSSPSGYESCSLEYISEHDTLARKRLQRSGWTEIAYDYCPKGDGMCYYFTNFVVCADCREQGTNEKPEYWPDFY